MAGSRYVDPAEATLVVTIIQETAGFETFEEFTDVIDSQD